MATFLFIENGKITPVTRYGNIDKFVGTLKKVYDDAAKGKQEQSQTPTCRLQHATSNSASYENTS